MTFVADLAALIVLGFLAYVVIYMLHSSYEQDRSKRRAANFYYENKIAYKVGLIKKYATENEVELIFPAPEDEFMNTLDQEVDEDIKDAEVK